MYLIHPLSSFLAFDERRVPFTEGVNTTSHRLSPKISTRFRGPTSPASAMTRLRRTKTSSFPTDRYNHFPSRAHKLSGTPCTQTSALVCLWCISISRFSGIPRKFVGEMCCYLKKQSSSLSLYRAGRGRHGMVELRQIFTMLLDSGQKGAGILWTRTGTLLRHSRGLSLNRRLFSQPIKKLNKELSSWH